MQNRKLRILFSSNAPWSPSGYGQQMAQILPRIKAMGHEVGCIAYYGLEGGKVNIDGIDYFPRLKHTYGSDAMWFYQDKWKADCVITLQDTWVLHPDDLQKVKNWIPIVPFDHDPIPPAVMEKLRFAYRVASMSEHGHDLLLHSGYHSTYLPHTIDANKMKPRDKTKAREVMNVDKDCYLFGMVSANKDNPPRKSFQEVMDAFKAFHAKHDEARLYLHLSQNDPNQGFPVDDYARFIGIEHLVYKTPEYEQATEISVDDMSHIYSAFDCLLSPSSGEGFGVPVIEAQACGVPAIVTDFTAMSEHVNPGITGELVKVAHKRFTWQRSYVGQPDTQDLLDKMERVYKYSGKESTKTACRKHVLRKFDGDIVFDKHWKPFLETLQKELIKD